MFKKLTILVLVTLLVLTSATACSSETAEEAIPPVVAATEQEPTVPDATLATTPGPTNEVTPSPTPENNPGPAVEEDPDRIIPVPEFIQGVIDGKYQPGDIVTISGTLLYRPELDTYDSYYRTRMGPETSGHVVGFITGGQHGYPSSVPSSIKSFYSFNKFFSSAAGDKQAKPGDELVVRGTLWKVVENIVVLYPGDVFLLEVRK